MADEHVSLVELATAAGVSERTLETVFNEYYGVGPRRYLHLRQLNLIRCALKAANPETASVTEVLAVGTATRQPARSRGRLPSGEKYALTRSKGSLVGWYSV